MMRKISRATVLAIARKAKPLESRRSAPWIAFASQIGAAISGRIDGEAPTEAGSSDEGFAVVGSRSNQRAAVMAHRVR